MLASCVNATGIIASRLAQAPPDLLVPQTLQTMDRNTGYGIARRIEQVSANALLINQGTIYASPVRLQHRGWISAAGRVGQQLAVPLYTLDPQRAALTAPETSYWRSLTSVVERVLQGRSHGGDQ